MKIFQAYDEHNLLIDQQKSQVEIEARKLKTEKKKLEEITKYQQAIEESKRRVTEVKSQLEDLQKQLPAENQKSEVLRLFNSLAEEVSIRNRNFSPQTDKQEEGYVAEPYSFQGQATYIQFLVFFERIFLSGRLFDFDEVHLKRASSSEDNRYNYLDVRAKVYTYRYLPPQTITGGQK